MGELGSTVVEDGPDDIIEDGPERRRWKRGVVR